ncbi:hypothetical protein MXD58_023600, partial [Frankia sp. AgKG'84/4]
MLAVALASAIDDVREARFEADGRPWASRALTAVATHPGGYPTMTALAQSGYRPGTDERFDERLRLVLLGIAAECGLAVDPVVGGAGGAPAPAPPPPPRRHHPRSNVLEMSKKLYL